MAEHSGTPKRKRCEAPRWSELEWPTNWSANGAWNLLQMLLRRNPLTKPSPSPQAWVIFAFPLYPLSWLPKSAARTEHGKSKRCSTRAKAEARQDTFHHEWVGNQGEILMFSYQFLHKHQILPQQQNCIIWNVLLPRGLKHCLMWNADKEARTNRLLKYYSINTIAAMILRRGHKPTPPEKGIAEFKCAPTANQISKIYSEHTLPHFTPPLRSVFSTLP